MMLAEKKKKAQAVCLCFVSVSDFIHFLLFAIESIAHIALWLD